MRIVIDPTTIRFPISITIAGHLHEIGHLELDLGPDDVEYGLPPEVEIRTPFHYDFAPDDLTPQPE